MGDSIWEWAPWVAPARESLSETGTPNGGSLMSELTRLLRAKTRKFVSQKFLREGISE